MKISITYDVGKELVEECSRITGLEAQVDQDGNGEIIIGFRNLDVKDNTVLVQTLSAGVNHLNFNTSNDNVTICSNAGAYSNIVTELVYALLLSHSKKISFFDSETKEGRFTRIPTPILEGMTMGILGYGGIGRQVARVAKAMDMKTLGHSRSGRRDEFLDDISSSAGDLFARSDIVLIATPLTKATKGMVNRELLSRFRGKYIINIARADVVHRDDMLAFLKENPEKFYLTDVWWGEPEISDPVPENAVLTPHVGGYSPENIRKAMILASENVKRFLDGHPENVVDVSDYI